MSQSPTFDEELDREALFAPVDQARSSERIADVIRRTILDGRFQPGEQLPPERTLAERFRVTRNTVREALRNLEQLRLVSIRHGSGVTVQDYLATAGIELVSSLLVPEKGASQELLDHVLEARRVVGQAICHHAVEVATRDVLPGLDGAIRDFVREASLEAPDPRRLQALDFEVQNRLIRAGGNRVFVLLHNSLRHVYERVARFFEPVVADPQAMVSAYRALLAALSIDDRRAARRAITALFEGTTPRRKERR